MPAFGLVSERCRLNACQYFFVGMLLLVSLEEKSSEKHISWRACWLLSSQDSSAISFCLDCQESVFTRKVLQTCLQVVIHFHLAVYL